MEKDKISKFTQEMELLKAFLADHYRFRRNVITGGARVIVQQKQV